MKLRGPLAKLVNWWRGYPTTAVTANPESPVATCRWTPADEVERAVRHAQLTSHYSQLSSSDLALYAKYVKAEIQKTLSDSQTKNDRYIIPPPLSR